MKTISSLCLPVLLAVSLASCGGGNKNNVSNDAAQEAAKAMTGSGNSISNAVTNAANASQEKMKERRAKGDTLAMPYADLQKYLPQSIDGYKADKPDGATVNMGQVSYSSAIIRFSKDNGDWVKVSIIDYNQAYQLYSGATALWAMGMSVDSPQEKAEGVKLDNNVTGWEVYQKNSKNATITLGVGSRFLVSVDANNQTDVEMVKSVIKTIDLSKLASM